MGGGLGGKGSTSGAIKGVGTSERAWPDSGRGWAGFTRLNYSISHLWKVRSGALPEPVTTPAAAIGPPAAARLGVAMLERVVCGSLDLRVLGTGTRCLVGRSGM